MPLDTSNKLSRAFIDCWGEGKKRCCSDNACTPKAVGRNGNAQELEKY